MSRLSREVIFVAKVISPRSRPHYTHSHDPCPGHNSQLECLIWIIFHTNVVHGPRVCHDFDPRSCLQGQYYNVHIGKIGVLTIPLHQKHTSQMTWNFLSWDFTLCLFNWSCRINCTLLKISMPLHSVGIQSTWTPLICYRGGLCPVRTGLVTVVFWQ